MTQENIDAKKLARSLQGALKDLGVTIKLGTAQEAVAKITGNGNWRTIAALKKQQNTSAETILPAPKPRVLITVSGGVADYVCTPGVECFVFDRDSFEADPEGTEVAPSHFADLAYPNDVPYDTGIKILDETAPQAVRDAFEHVRSVFPNVVQVYYSPSGSWAYTDKEGYAESFEGLIDTDILDDGANAVESLPATFRLPEPSNEIEASSKRIDGRDLVVHGIGALYRDINGKKVARIDEANPAFFGLYRVEDDGSEEWVEDFKTRDLAMAKKRQIEVRERFERLYAYQDIAQKSPVMQNVIARIARAVEAMRGVKGVKFCTNRTDRANPKNAPFFAHDGQEIVEFLMPALRSVEPDDLIDEECLPYYRVRFADGTVLICDDSELVGVNVPLGNLIDAVSGAFRIARSLHSYAGVWDLVATGRAGHIQAFESAYARYNVSASLMESRLFAEEIWQQEKLRMANESAKENGGTAQEFILADVYPEPAADLTELENRVTSLEDRLNAQAVMRFRQSAENAELVFADYATITRSYSACVTEKKD